MNNLLPTLVTGSSGRVGKAVVAELLARGLPVRGFDRVPTPGLADMVVGDITDRATVERAVRGTGTVIHLAATPDDDDFFAQLLPNNLAALHHVMEAARIAGVKRVVLASSGQVNWWQQMNGPWPVRVTDPVSPRYWYAATKMFMEAIGRGYAEKHEVSVIVVRLGWCPRTREQVEEIAVADWAQDVYFSPGDAGRFFAATVTAPLAVKFAIVFAASQPVHKMRFDMEPTKQLFGYEPRERWPDGVEIILGHPL